MRNRYLRRAKTPPASSRLPDGSSPWADTRLSDIATLLGGSDTDLALDAIEFGDACECFRGDRRGTALREVIDEMTILRRSSRRKGARIA